MSEIAHTPEPWRIESVEDWFNIVGSDGSRAASDGSAAGEYGPDMSMENGRRIVACVNALQGVSTEKLEEAAKLGITDVSMGNLFSSRLKLQTKLREAEQEIAYLNSRLNGGV
jgi:hypothetical protein